MPSSEESSEVAPGNQRLRQQLCCLVPFILIVGTAVVLMLTLPVNDYLSNASDWIAAKGFVGGLVYFLVFSLWLIVCLPATPLQLVAGFTFNFGWGYVISLLASIVGASTSFAIGRAAGADMVRTWMLSCKCRRGLKLIDAIELAVEQQGWRIILLMQFAYIPAGVKNYGFTLIKSVKFRLFLVRSSVIIANNDDHVCVYSGPSLCRVFVSHHLQCTQEQRHTT
jgi:uncharacterized membrane protein YdjX (TVP38/TMEM64 family)